MAIRNVSVKITGTSSLILHNGLLADPQYSFTKAIREITKKRTKTEADLEELSRLEFLGGLYVGADERVIIPDKALLATVVSGAKKSKSGPAAKAGVFVKGHAVLENVTKKPMELWETGSSENGGHVFRCGAKSKGSGGTVMRTRPIFPEWTCVAHFEIVDDLVSEKDLMGWLEVAGIQVGTCDWRPQHGRFTVERI
jgi:hypothetical protein